MNLPKPIAQLNNKLQGLPDNTLTLLLLSLAGVLVIVAFTQPALVKAGVAAWVMLP